MHEKASDPTETDYNVGNRMNVLFHLAGVFYFLRQKLLDYLKTYCNIMNYLVFSLSPYTMEDLVRTKDWRPTIDLCEAGYETSRCA